jgi:DNA-binding LytR/AlgR family response regulator
MDGAAMAEKIREFDSNVPIVFLTNIKDTDGSPQRSDAYDYIIKADTRIDDIVTKIKVKLGIV